MWWQPIGIIGGQHNESPSMDRQMNNVETKNVAGSNICQLLKRIWSIAKQNRSLARLWAGFKSFESSFFIVSGPFDSEVAK